MDAGDKDLVKAAAEGTSKGVADSVLKPFHELTGHFCQEIGEAGGYIGTLVRLRVGILVMKKAEKMLNNIGVKGNAISRKLFLPLLENATLEDNDSLQTKWAALLANASMPGSDAEIRVAFPDILRQLSSSDVRFLDLLYDHVCENAAKVYGIHDLSANSIQDVEMRLDTVAEIYDKLPHREPVKTAYRTYGDDKKYPDMTHQLSTKALIIRNCMRLGLIDRALKLGRLDTSHYSANTVPQETVIFLTALGYEFVKACRPPEPTQN